MVVTIGVSVSSILRFRRDFFRSRIQGGCPGSPGPAGHLISGAGGEGEVVRPAGPGRSRRGDGQHVAGTSGGGNGGKSGADAAAIETAGVTQKLRGPGDRPDARRPRTCLERHLPAGQSGRAHRRPVHQQRISYTLQSQDFDLLSLWGPKILERLRKLPHIADVNSDLENSGLFECDRGSRHGFTPRPHRAGGRQRALRCVRQRQVSRCTSQSISIMWCWRSSSSGGKARISCRRSIFRRRAGPTCRSPFHPFYRKLTPLHCRTQGSFLRRPFPSIWRTAPTQRCGGRDQEGGGRYGRAREISGSFAGTAKAFQDSLSTEPILIRTALWRFTLCSGSFTRA